jgi:hypothetical protein
MPTTKDTLLTPTGETPEQIIARVGWMVQLVFSGPGEDEPSFAYTIGLAAKGLPELITFSLPAEIAYYALNVLAKRLVDGEQIAIGERVADALQADVILTHTAITLTDRYMFQAKNRDPHYTALQMVWPDPKTGSFPWEAGYGERYAKLQPLLRASDLH